MNNDKVNSLKAHLIKVKNQAQNPNKKYQDVRLESYKEWVALEVKRTEAKIKELMS